MLDNCLNVIVKKKFQDNNLENKKSSSDIYSGEDKIKTTNVNILLNRVRLNEKKTLKNRIIFFIALSTLISLLAVYFVI